MAHPFYHAASSARRFGGVAADYYELHTFFDQAKRCVPSNVHRLLLHNDFGIDLCEQIYGQAFHRPSDQIMMLTRKVARQHIFEDFGFLPTLEMCLQQHPLHHAARSEQRLSPDEQTAWLARKLGGTPKDYQELVAWFHVPALMLNDPRFFRVLGNSFGIFLAEQRFGIAVTRASDTKALPTRYVAEQLVHFTLGSIPTLSHFFRHMQIESWMWRGARKLSMIEE